MLKHDEQSEPDLLQVLRTLADGVRGMGLGDPDCGERIEASDIVRWAVNEIERLRMSHEEREAIHFVVGDVADITKPPEVTLRGLLERTA
jgi:hypothetical protein